MKVKYKKVNKDWNNQYVTKLDGVGPVDNRPSTDKLYQFVWKKKNKLTWDMWYVTCDMFGGGGWTFSQNFGSLPLTVCDLC